MKSCWELTSMSRPTFADLVKQLSAYLEYIASYVILSDLNGPSKDIEVKCGETGSTPKLQVEESAEIETFVYN